MRILHTSDWHLNDKLGRHERQPDLYARMEEIARILKDEAVDVMLIAGDLFSERQARLPELRKALEDFDKVFRPFLDAGGTAVAISGNHDSEDLFELLRVTQRLAAPVQRGGPAPPGRLYLVAQPLVLPLAGRDGQEVQVVLMPYPTPSFLFKNDETFQSAEERNRLLRDRAVEYLRKQVDGCAARPLPSVLVAHLHVRNSALPHSLYKIEERDDVVLDPGLIPSAFAYIAFGHIHRAQEIDGSPFIRYSGSIERMDVAERADDKGVVLVDIGAVGASPPRVVSLDATPIFDEEITGPEDLPRLASTYTPAQRERGYLRYRLRCRGQDEQTLHRDVRRLFPRWYDAKVELTDGVEAGAAASVSSARLRDTAGTARKFVDERLAGQDVREPVLHRLAGLLDETEVQR
jgi:DNA repair protein SbcD/Mre11